MVPRPPPTKAGRLVIPRRSSTLELRRPSSHRMPLILTVCGVAVNHGADVAGRSAYTTRNT